MWSGLIFALAIPTATRAQDQAAPDAQAAADPIELAARRVQVWDTAGERWAILSGEAAVLQAGDGLRARAAVVRILEVPMENGKGYQAEIYAEGEVRISGQGGPPRPQARTVLRTRKQVQLRAYKDNGFTQWKEPPRDLLILRRSGFVLPEPATARPELAAARSEPAAARSEPAAARSEPAIAQPEPATTQPEPAAAPEAQILASATPRSASQVETVAVADSVPSSATAETATVLPPPDLPPLEPVPPPMSPRKDPELQLAQFERKDPVVTQVPGTGPARPDAPAEVPPTASPPADGTELPSVDLPPIEGRNEVEVPNLANPEDVPRSQPLPGTGDQPAAPLRRAEPGRGRKPKTATPPSAPTAPILPGSRRVTNIFPRSGRKPDVIFLPEQPDGTRVVIYRGGINMVTKTPQFGVVDIEAESAVVWRHPDPKKGAEVYGPNGELIENANQPMEVYLEGNVIFRQDENKSAGKADQRTYRAPRAYYDFLRDRFVALNGEVDLFAPGFISPMKMKSPRIDQFHKLLKRPDGTLIMDPEPEIRTERTLMTGSRFPDPAYKINNRTVDLIRQSRPLTDPNTGKQVGDPNDPNPPMDLIWRYDARQNFFYMGPIPVFYWPRLTGETDDLESPLRMISFGSISYFGEELLTAWNGFKVIGVKRPYNVDIWNLDLDYLSARTKDFPALGSEIGWFGRDLFRDLTDPYHKDRNAGQSITYDYFGYFDIWGLKDSGIDVLGSGPAVVTQGPAGAGKRGYQRSDVPPFQDIRGRFNIRQMQRFLPDDDEHHFEDLRFQLEIAYVSDRQFLEEYYKRLNETGMDQETLGYMQYQKNNWSWDIWAEANLQTFNTDTQWLPRLDYYRLGDSLFSNLFNYYQHSGVDYANVHTDVMVNNPNLFAFMPYDPISNTSGPWSSLRAYTNHEIDMPLNIYDVVRVMPYLQGQIVGWSNQLGGGPFGQQSTGPMARFWGAAGVHTEMTAYKLYPNVENEILNIHGLNNKISFFTDFRAAFANQQLNSIAVQDDLDDNEYEFVRRYFAITNWTGGILPGPYDPRALILRRALSPITGTTDIQSTITMLQLGIHQRLQTKRGPEGKRRIIDWMTLDLHGTYFPDAQRDNFGKPWGQTMYNYQWFVGDRTSIISYGWFDFWNLTGSQPLSNYNVAGYNPKGLNVITTGVSLSRPPRGNVFIGYTVINTGTINTSALNVSTSYWLSPKWFGTFSTSYDFGNKIPLGSMLSFTRIGADYLTSIGMSYDPQRSATQFAVQISPRLSPNLRLGGATGMNQFDSRYAPTE
ncbi:MAG: hypothetical protein ABSH35_13685 [Isosphaeraceae bacterium]